MGDGRWAISCSHAPAWECIPEYDMVRNRYHFTEVNKPYFCDLYGITPLMATND